MDGIHDTPEERARALGGTVRRFAPMRGRVKTPDNLPPGLIEVPLEDAPPEAGSRGGRCANGADRWPEPLDVFTNEGAPVTPIDEHHVPPTIARLAADVSGRLGTEAAAVALASLATCAAAATDDWQVQPRRHDDTWRECPRLWVGLIGPPSALKTPTIRSVTAPLVAIEADARREHAKELAAWRSRHANWKATGADPATEPPRPRCPRWIVESATVEALSEVLRDDCDAKFVAPARKALLIVDEMSEWLANLDRYRTGGRGGGDRGAYLRAWNGGRYVVDRVLRGSLAVPNWSLCIVGGIQPEVVAKIAAEAADDGLLQRFIFVATAGGEGVDVRPDHAALNAYRDTVRALTTLAPPRLDGISQVVTLAAEAHEWRERCDALAQAFGQGAGTSPKRAAWAAKLRGTFARLALTMHLVDAAAAIARGEQPPPLMVLQARHAEMAWRLVRDILIPHWCAAERAMFGTAAEGHAQTVAAMILATGAERVTARDIGRACRALRGAERRRALITTMTELEDMHWVVAEPPRLGADAPHAWRVNPLVQKAFGVRAAVERERRAAIALKLARLYGGKAFDADA